MDEQLLIGIMMLILGASLPLEWGLEKWKRHARKRRAALRYVRSSRIPQSHTAVQESGWTA